jgi:glycosyltransferase involved in cell wall biosynthesis
MSPPPPRLSIVITSFNHRAFLVDAIESVLAQTLMPHEIIVADDGSSDGSPDTIQAYQRRFPGLVKGVFRDTNGGIPKNRNGGLRAVTGDYVGILDGDDWFLPHKLEAQVAALRAAGDATLAYGNFRVVDAQRRHIRLKWTERQPSGHVFADIAAGKTGLLRTLIADYQAVKDAGFMEERFPRHDGLWLTMKLAARCKIAYVDDVLVDKRDHADSDSKTIRSEERLRELAGIYRDLLPMLPRHASPEEQARIRLAWGRVLSASTEEVRAER